MGVNTRIYDTLSNMLATKRSLNVFDAMLIQQLTRGVDIGSLSYEQAQETVRGILAQLTLSATTINNVLVNNNTGSGFTSILGETVEVSLQNELGVANNTILLRNIELLLLPVEMGMMEKVEGTVLQKVAQLPLEYLLYAVFSVSDFAGSLGGNKVPIKNTSELATAANDSEFILFLTPNLAFLYLESPFEEDLGEPIALKIDLVQQSVLGLDAEDRLSLAELVGYINIMDVLEE